MSVFWGLLMWLAAYRGTGAWAIVVLIPASLIFGYLQLHLLRRRHCRSLYWVNPQTRA
jgi:hypothetical protein